SEAGQVTATFQREIAAIRANAAALVADSRVTQATAAAATGATGAAASAKLGDLLRRDSGAVIGVTLRDTTGVKAAYGAPIDPTLVPDGAPVEGLTTVTTAPDSASLVLVTLPDAAGAPRFELITVISLPALLSWSSPTVK